MPDWPVLFVFLKYIFGMCLPKDILVNFRTSNALMVEFHEQTVTLVFQWFTYSGLVYWENLSNSVRFQGNSTAQTAGIFNNVE